MLLLLVTLNPILNMKTIAIDEGNTSTKLAFFENYTLVHKESDVSFKRVQELVEKAEYMILSSVKKESKYHTLINHESSIVLNHNTPLPIKNKYNSPETLGNDRLALVVGASHKFPNTDVLVIDAGTCITFDFLNAQKEYLGGSISPGIQMRFKALHNQTNQLPLINTIQSNQLIGASTEESIASGVINGVCSEIDGIIERYAKDYSGLKVIVTGGDTKFFDKALKNTIFAAPNLLMEGLSKILHYNESNI